MTNHNFLFELCFYKRSFCKIRITPWSLLEALVTAMTQTTSLQTSKQFWTMTNMVDNHKRKFLVKIGFIYEEKNRLKGCDPAVTLRFHHISSSWLQSLSSTSALCSKVILLSLKALTLHNVSFHSVYYHSHFIKSRKSRRTLRTHS